MNKLSHKRLVDSLVEAYVSWREACVQVSDAYGSWSSGPGPGATAAFGVYVAALDQEERAAEVYAALVRRVGPLVSSTSDLFKPGGGTTAGLSPR